MLPDSEFRVMSRSTSIDKIPMVDGILPVKLFSLTMKALSLVRYPMEVGTDPVNLLRCNSVNSD